MSVTVRSRIHEHFNLRTMESLYNLCKNPTISDNNKKGDIVCKILRDNNVDFIELGIGTNRIAVLIDNYVFKIALDRRGLLDNVNEYSMSHELQPYVVKTYETNSIISVSEYVTVISKEEFRDKREYIQDILSILADSYLLGDVGTVEKNFCNWGYRDNGDLVILDFAYVNRVKGEELLCSNDKVILQYDENFHELICPKCRKKYRYIDLRARISREEEERDNEFAKQLSYKLTQPIQEFDESQMEMDEEKSQIATLIRGKQIDNDVLEEDKSMSKHDEDFRNDDQDDAYLDALADLTIMKRSGGRRVVGKVEETKVEVEQQRLPEINRGNANQVKESETIQVNRSTPTENSSIRIFRQHLSPSGSVPEPDRNEPEGKSEEEILGDMFAEEEDLPEGAYLRETMVQTSVISEQTEQGQSHEEYTVERDIVIAGGDEDIDDETDHIIVAGNDQTKETSAEPEVVTSSESSVTYVDTDGDGSIDKIRTSAAITTERTVGDSRADDLRRQLESNEEEEEEYEELHEQAARENLDRRRGGNKSWE